MECCEAWETLQLASEVHWPATGADQYPGVARTYLKLKSTGELKPEGGNTPFEDAG